MIELNCSYEESKKILQLGYDFRKICTKFEVKTDIEYQVCHGAVITSDKWNRVEIESSRVIQDEGKLEHGQRIAFNPLSIPIIPKAALEKCLPDSVGIDCRYFRKFYKTKYSEEEFEVYEAGVNELESNAVVFDCKSIYEMFLWVHENYSKELKKKFSEVMG
jgi:hypothetical protein